MRITSLKSKIQLAIVGTFIVLLAGVLGLFNLVVMNDFQVLEDESARNNVHRVEEAINSDVESFAKRGADQAYWDDAYTFVDSLDPDFISSNLSAEALSVLEFRAVAYFARNGELRFGALVSDAEGETEPLPADLLNVGRMLLPTITGDNDSDEVKGFVRVDGGVNIVAALPILDSNKAKEPNGVLVVFRDYNEEDHKAVSQRTRLTVAINVLPDVVKRSSKLTSSPTGTSLQIAVVNEETLLGSSEILDVFGSPILELQVTLPRNIYQRALNSRLFLALALVLCLVVACIGAVLVIHRWVTSRVTDLARQLNEISVNQEFGRRVDFSGSDEIRDLGANINGTLNALNDAQARVEEALIVAKKANRAKSMFIARVSHELRTPVAGIIGLNDMLQKRAGDQRGIKELLGMQGVSAEGLLTIINEILDFSTIEQGKLTYENIEFEPRVVVRDALQVLAGRILTRPADAPLQLVLDVDPNVSRTLKGDPTKLKQILVNLIGNGIKFTQRGNVGVRVTGVQGDGAKRWVQFDVWDTGIGIPGNKLATVFEPFTQVDETVKRKYQGTGLGLTIVKQMTEGMGGSVTVESVEGKGSTFRIVLPFDRVTDAPYTVNHPGVWPGMFAVIGQPSRVKDSIESGLQRLGGRLCAASGDLDQVRKADLIVILEDAAQDPEWLTFVQGEVAAHRGCIVPVVSLAQGELRQKLHSFGIRTIFSSPVLADDIVSVLIAERTKAKADAVAAQAAPVLPTHTRPLRILVADDTPTNRLILEDLLTEAGHTVVCVDDGQKLVDRLRPMLAGESGAEGFDIVLTDISMPIMDGYSATEAIRTIEKNSTSRCHVPIVAITAHILTEEQERMKAAGMDDVLTKPIRAAAVAEVFQNLVRG